MTLIQRHERFTWAMAADPNLQLGYEAERFRQREFMLGGIDHIVGNDTAGASAFAGEIERLRMRNSEAKRRALVGADPMNLTGHSKGIPLKKDLATAPIERVGHITRTVPAHARLKGKNKLDDRQSLAAGEYRDAYETVRSSLGGVMDFDRARGGSSSPPSPAEAQLAASQKLRAARNLVGQRAIVIIEHVVCEGRGIDETTRIMYGCLDGEPTNSRDVNYIGRALREALKELADTWFPTRPADKVRPVGWSASRLEQVVGAAGTVNITSKPYVSS